MFAAGRPVVEYVALPQPGSPDVTFPLQFIALMSRLVSFIVLVAVLLLVTGLFFRVMLEFLVPMFLAAVLVVVFRPMHHWFQFKFTGHPRVAAAATTLSIVLIVLLPSAAIGWNAYLEIASFGRQMLDERPTEFKDKLDGAIRAVTVPLEERFDVRLGEPEEIRERFKEGISNWGWAGEAGAAAWVAGQWLAVNFVRLVVGLAIMIISIYYFLADGPAMIVTVMRLSPLDDRYELELFERFSNISRSVVVATLLSAFVQGVLAGIGYYVADIHAVFALTGLTMLLAVVPFLGAAAVWLPTSAWLLLAENRTGAAIALALYGAMVVSTIDNVIKPYVLHGQSNLHPLLALLSVLGGVAALGPVGILVGPMVVAFLQALLGMLQREINEIGEVGSALATNGGMAAGSPDAEKASAEAGDRDAPPAEHALPEGSPETPRPKQPAKENRQLQASRRRKNKRRKRS